MPSRFTTAYEELIGITYLMEACCRGSFQTRCPEEWEELLPDLRTGSCVGGQAAFASRER
jgi:hypothetical protein